MTSNFTCCYCFFFRHSATDSLELNTHFHLILLLLSRLKTCTLFISYKIYSFEQKLVTQCTIKHRQTSQKWMVAHVVIPLIKITDILDKKVTIPCTSSKQFLCNNCASLTVTIYKNAPKPQKKNGKQLNYLITIPKKEKENCSYSSQGYSTEISQEKMFPNIYSKV